MRGSVRVGTLPYRFGKGVKTHPKIPGYINVNVTSGSNQWSRGLSPMTLGPFQVSEQLVPLSYYPSGIHPGFHYDPISGRQITVAQNFENYHQSLKYYNIDLDENGIIQPSFFERRAKMLADPKPHRRDNS